MTRIVGIAVVVLFAACGSGDQVGSGVDTSFEEQQDGRLGEIQRQTPAPTRAATPPPAARTAAPQQRGPAGPTPTPAPITVRLEVNAQGYKPLDVRVYRGTTIAVTNTDAQARTFTSDDPGVFDSGPIKPKATYTYVANRVGTFNFHDETRPFVVGKLEVLAK